ncbi:MAG: cytochrome C [Deltaproteobacteria bacterium]|nr:cytochrome C [Deltaproteobacteria bacterium]
MAQAKEGYFTRFSVRQRLEHLLIMVLFLVLALTGFPQKFFTAGWAQWLILHLGGIDRVRWLHRMSGILFSVVALEHGGVVLLLVLMKRIQLNMVPSKKDFWDAIVTLRYYLGLSEEQARFGRYDYRQKFEYWGLIFGGVIMMMTGFILYFPTLFARFLTGEVIPAAQVAHSNEGLLAFLVVILWHIYNAHLSPDVFPFDASIFTGRISEERMEHEHPLEYARVVAEKGESASPEEIADEGSSKEKSDEPSSE